jgi:hypothetical protein
MKQKAAQGAKQHLSVSREILHNVSVMVFRCPMSYWLIQSNGIVIVFAGIACNI